MIPTSIHNVHEFCHKVHDHSNCEKSHTNEESHNPQLEPKSSICLICNLRVLPNSIDEFLTIQIDVTQKPLQVFSGYLYNYCYVDVIDSSSRAPPLGA